MKYLQDRTWISIPMNMLQLWLPSQNLQKITSADMKAKMKDAPLLVVKPQVVKGCFGKAIQVSSGPWSLIHKTRDATSTCL